MSIYFILYCVIKYFITVLANPTTNVINDYILRCPKQQYWCNHHCIHITNYVCDGGNHCGGTDEKYCDHTVSLHQQMFINQNWFFFQFYHVKLCNKDGFKCGKQCVPKELVCDGKYDCLDGSDEVDCSTYSWFL